MPTSPLGSFFALSLLGIMSFVALALFVFFLRRFFAWMDRRGWITYSGDPPTYGSLGNAFQQLQSIYQPSVEYVLEEKRREKVEEDDIAGSGRSGHSDHVTL